MPSHGHLDALNAPTLGERLQPRPAVADERRHGLHAGELHGRLFNAPLHQLGGRLDRACLDERHWQVGAVTGSEVLGQREPADGDLASALRGIAHKVLGDRARHDDLVGDELRHELGHDGLPRGLAASRRQEEAAEGAQPADHRPRLALLGHDLGSNDARDGLAGLGGRLLPRLGRCVVAGGRRIRSPRHRAEERGHDLGVDEALDRHRLVKRHVAERPHPGQMYGPLVRVQRHHTQELHQDALVTAYRRGVCVGQGRKRP
mmetsp:Transcript_44063/g.113970  ORF Transcript_44063/g.113970 Transcript_44063/m.113970 type:complete len:261 (-) Transcript_44063:518-1300(-)